MGNKNKKIPTTVTVAVPEEGWLTAQQLALRMGGKSRSTIYSLVRRESGIPYAKLPKSNIILFNWKSVDQWLHKLEEENRRKNFEK
jgi:predicted DNA-binding transcriptional regulator AlpA